METGAMREMPKYQCHKRVWALKIKNIRIPAQPDPTAWNGMLVLDFEDEGYAPLLMDATYVKKHDPKPGGYYVVYDDGYKSYSPGAAFESGYTLIA